MRIDVTVDSRPDAWGPECTAELATRAAAQLAEWIGEALQQAYPEAEVTTSTHDYTEGETTKLVTISRCTPETWNAIHDLAGQVNESRWTEALAAVLPPKRRGPKPAAEGRARLTTTLPADVDRWLRAQPDGIGGSIARLVRAERDGSE